MKNKDVEDNITFETLAGSYSYGTATEYSDEDYRGICIPPQKSYYFGFGLNKFGQKDKGWEQEDRVIYDLRKFVGLAADGNPNILELLFTDRRFWIKNSKHWEKLWENRYKFLSKNARFRYLGYSYSQLNRIKRHRGYLLNPPKKQPARSDFGLPEKKLISTDHLGAYQWLIANLLKGSMEELNLSDATKKEIRDVNYIGLVQRGIPDDCYSAIQEITNATDEWIEIMMREKSYINSMNEWSAYQNWKQNRNKGRAKMEASFGYDGKHAQNLVRLLRIGLEILEKGELLVLRPDAKELLAIRNGAWTYEKLVKYAEKCEQQAIDLYETSSLPKNPNRVFLDELCCEIIGEYI